MSQVVVEKAHSRHEGMHWKACRLLNSLTAIVAHEQQLFNKLHWWLVTSPIFVRCQRLMARKIAEIFSFNRGVWPFYAACRFDELSRGSVLCLSNASFETAVSQRHKLIFWAKIDDHGIRRSNTVQILTVWRRPVAYSVATDLLHWAMCTSSHRRIAMAIKMASKGAVFFDIVDFVFTTMAKGPCYGP